MSEETIFLTALEHKDAAERAAYLDQVCGNDAVLRQRVEALLRSHADPDSFLDVPAVVRQAREEGYGATASFTPSGLVGPDTPTETMALGSGEKAAKPDPNQEVLALLAPPQKAGSLGRLDHYEILEIIGRGGMGVVLKGWDTKLRRIVAIKVLAPQLAANGTARSRFIREAQAAAAVRDEHVVSIYAVNDERAVPYLVMEYIAGVTLAGKVKKNGPLEVKEVLRIGLQAARGLAAAHAQGLIHRDVTPGNILLENGVQRVKLTDFGLARALDDGNLSQQGIIAGTPLYMSPEQARGEKLGQRSDLFSLGSVLYTLCTGRAAFGAGNTLAIMKRVCEDTPRPLRQVNPDFPDWLAAIIEKLMAKNPADRIQTATELADTLGEHLARLQQSGLAAALPAAPAAPRSWSRVAVLLVVSLLALFLVGAAVMSWLHLFPPDNSNLIAGNGPEKKPSSPPDKVAPPPDKVAPPAPDKNPPPAPADPKVLTVSQKPEDGGKYRTINEALDKVEPGMTIRVLDSAVYVEALKLTRASQFEGLTLEAPKQATLQAPPPSGIKKIDLVAIKGIADLTFRGFRLRGDKHVDHSLLVNGKCPGLTLEHLEFEGSLAKHTIAGIVFGEVTAGEKASKIAIRDNVFRRQSVAIWIDACGWPDYNVAYPCGQISIQGNEVIDCMDGILLEGSLSQIQVVGNKVLWATRLGIQLENVLPGSRDILIANNSILESADAFRVWDTAPKGENIRICNNLFLGHDDSDMMFWKSMGTKGTAGPGDGLSVTKAWNFASNWRELKNAAEKKPGWIPPSDTDKVLRQIDVLSRKPGDKNFLKPPKDSPLATAGAGPADQALPVYVGAVPPDGVKPWDWDTTWKALIKPAEVKADPKVLTVSKRPEDKAQFSTINAALDKVQPGMTVRVLDDAVYEEELGITFLGRHSNIVLEAVGKNRATIRIVPGKRQAVIIDGVPGVTVRGFHFAGVTKDCTQIHITHSCPGVTLEQLDMTSELNGGCINLFALSLNPSDPPVVVQNCYFRKAGTPLWIEGLDRKNVDLAIPSSNIVLRNNTFEQCRSPIVVMGAVQRLHIVGNVIMGSDFAALDLLDLLADARDILIANNTLWANRDALRIWDDHAKGAVAVQCKNIRVQNNLVLQPKQAADFIYQDHPRGNPDTAKPGKLQDFLKAPGWHFDHNWREIVKLTPANPLFPGWIHHPGDHLETPIKVISYIPGNKDFLRPPQDSPLATAGAGPADPSLPAYVGAVPPEGVKPWDWDKTWKALIKKEKTEPDILTVSQKEADGGTYRTINAALFDVKPGQTIRVLDKAVYKEYLRIDQADQFAGITLEAVNGATIQATGEGGKVLTGAELLVQIHNVPKVTLRGFHFRRTSNLAKPPNCVFVETLGQIAGTRLEKLEFHGDETLRAIEIANTALAATDAPVLVQGCVFRSCGTGVYVYSPLAGGNAVVCENLFSAGSQGIGVFGKARKVLVLGNRFVGAASAMTVGTLFPGAGDLIFVNNTTQGCAIGFRFWDGKVQGDNIQVRNNLFLGPHHLVDMAYVDSGGVVDAVKGPGDGKLLLSNAGWTISHNWREAADKPTPPNIPFRIPKAKTDHEAAEIKLLSREATHPDFLRPDKDSPLATAGDGRNDPPLPAWVGAVPPEGVAPWGWEKTWKALAK